MADDLDAELLALAGDSEEEHSPPPDNQDGSPAHSSDAHSPHRERSPAMGRKGTAKPTRRSKAARDDEEGEM